MSQTTEAVTEVRADVVATMESQDGSGKSTQSKENADPVTETSSARVPYIGEDARMTLLRQFDDMAREMAAKLSECSTRFSYDVLRLLPSMTRGWIQIIGELQAEKGKAQAENEQIQADDERIHERISSLVKENGKLDNIIIQLRHQKEELTIENADLSTSINRVGQDLTRARKERDLFKRKLEEAQIPLGSEAGSEAVSDGEGRAKKRNREN